MALHNNLPRFDPNADHVLRILIGAIAIFALVVVAAFVLLIALTVGWWILLAPVIVVTAIFTFYVVGTVIDWLMGGL